MDHFKAAQAKYGHNNDVDILDDVDTPPNDGAWVTALIWVGDDKLETTALGKCR